MNITLRPALESDLAFLIALRTNTMQQYLKQAGMPTDKEDFIQRIRYKFECANIVLVDEQPAGLFKAEYIESENMWYLIQIQIHPDFQNQKIGSYLIGRLIDKANLSHANVGLSVIKQNPAYALYTRLGFTKVGENAFEYELIKSPN